MRNTQILRGTRLCAYIGTAPHTCGRLVHGLVVQLHQGLQFLGVRPGIRPVWRSAHVVHAAVEHAGRTTYIGTRFPFGGFHSGRVGRRNMNSDDGLRCWKKEKKNETKRNAHEPFKF